MDINENIFRAYDIRGVAGEDLTAENVEALGKAYGTFLHRRKIKEAVVGRDVRLSGPEFHAAFVKGLISTGVAVFDLGVTMIHAMYNAQYRLQVNGGAMITASHNPARFNGFKLATGYSQTTEREELQEIMQIFREDAYVVADTPGTVTEYDYTEEYYTDILKRVSLSQPLKIVVDSGHGTTGQFVPELLKRAGCEVIGQHLEPDGSFPAGTPDPTAIEMIDRLRDRVLAEKADIGFGFDADGDRIGVVDDTGAVIWNDVLVALFAQEILGRFPGAKIVYNNLCSQVVRKTIKRAGGEPLMWLTGHAYIKSKLTAEKAPFGGELSGHFFFADNFYGHDDGCFAMMRLLEYVTSQNKPLSELVADLPQYLSSPEVKVGCPDDKKKDIVSQLNKNLKADFPDADISDDTTIPHNDGVRADFEDGMMVIRYSQNGPYITIKFEAQDQAVYDERKRYIREALEQYAEIVWEGDLAVNVDSLRET